MVRKVRVVYIYILYSSLLELKYCNISTFSHINIYLKCTGRFTRLILPLHYNRSRHLPFISETLLRHSLHSQRTFRIDWDVVWGQRRCACTRSLEVTARPQTAWATGHWNYSQTKIKRPTKVRSRQVARYEHWLIVRNNIEIHLMMKCIFLNVHALLCACKIDCIPRIKLFTRLHNDNPWLELLIVEVYVYIYIYIYIERMREGEIEVYNFIKRKNILRQSKTCSFFFLNVHFNFF